MRCPQWPAHLPAYPWLLVPRRAVAPDDRPSEGALYARSGSVLTDRPILQLSVTYKRRPECAALIRQYTARLLSTNRYLSRAARQQTAGGRVERCDPRRGDDQYWEPISSNDEVERRASSPTGATLSQSFDPSCPHRSCDTLLQPIVRHLRDGEPKPPRGTLEAIATRKASGSETAPPSP